jgi:lipid A 4'-phosphatase
MRYLKLKRSRLMIGSFLLFAALISAFPVVDLQISALFFDGRSFIRDQWWQNLLTDGLGWFLGLSFLSVVVMYACNRLLGGIICNIDGPRVLFLLLLGLIGAGLIVNVAFKNNVGRARPRDVAEFGGPRHFTPAFVITNQCRTNCSFSSGDAAGGFFAMGLAMALTRRRRYFVAAIAFGVVVSIGRISAGAHFFSDTVVSFFVMLITADVLFHYLVASRGQEGARELVPAPVPAFAPRL